MLSGKQHDVPVTPGPVTPGDTHDAAPFWPHLFEPFRNVAHSVANFFSPSIDAANANDRYEINVELPGVEADDIEVTLDDNVLTLKGEKREQREEKGKSFYFSERRYGSFQRSFRLPADVGAEQIDATFKNGVLTLGIPKLNASPQDSQKIPIKT